MSSASSRARTAKPESPARVHRQTWSYVGRRTIQEFLHDGCVDIAGSLTFFAVLSVFPAGLAIVAMVGVLTDSETVLDRLLSLLDQVAPEAVTQTLRDPLIEVAGASTAGWTFLAAIAAAVWSASLYVGAFGRALNRIYGVTEGRPYWKRKPAQLGVTIGLILLVLIVAAVVVLSGPVTRAIGDAWGIGDTALVVWDIAKWPILAVAVVVMVTALYKGTSNLRQPPLRWLALGAVLAIAGSALSSTGLIFYVANFASYNRTFGALAGVVVFLLWLFLINLALLLGAEFNAELERGRQLQGGEEAEVQLRLPLRDTTMSRRTERSAEITEEHGVLLREGKELPPRDDTVLRRALTRLRELRARGMSRRS